MSREKILRSPEYWSTIIQMALYDCAKKFMAKRKMNQRQLATYLGVSTGYVSQVLNGDYDHRLSKFVDLSLAFGYVPKVEFVSVEDVITSEENDACIDGRKTDKTFILKYTNAA